MKHLALILAVLPAVLPMAVPTLNHDSNATSNTESTPRPHSRRLRPPADDQKWNDLICRGNTLLYLMNANDKDAGTFLKTGEPAQSKFTNFPTDLIKWGFLLSDNEIADLGYEYYGLQDMLEDVGASHEEKDWKQWKCTHGDLSPNPQVPLDQQRYTVDDKTYRVCVQQAFDT